MSTRADTPPPTRPAGPRRLSPDRRAASIRAATRELALAEGLHALSLRSVAKAAGVTAPLVAHYAATMDDLVAQTFTAITGDELADLQSRVAGLAAPAALQVLVEALVETDRAEITGIWVDAWSLGRRNETLAAAVRRQMDRWHLWVRRLIGDGVAAGTLRTTDPDQAAADLVAMVDGVNAHALVRYRTADQHGAALRRVVTAAVGDLPSSDDP